MKFQSLLEIILGDLVDKINIISYIPMCYSNSPGRLFENKDDQQQAFIKIADIVEQNRDADACMWTYDEAMGFIPVLVYDDAKAIYDHLMWWCDNNPHKWFKIAMKITDSAYAITVIPNLKKSFDRWKFARKELHQDNTTYDSNNVTYLYAALGFSSSTCSIRQEMEKLLYQPMFRVGFMSLSDIDKDNPSASNFDKILYIDGIKKDTSDIANKHLEHMLNLVKERKMAQKFFCDRCDKEIRHPITEVGMQLEGNMIIKISNTPHYCDECSERITEALKNILKTSELLAILGEKVVISGD
jgi:hypothetical protein